MLRTTTMKKTVLSRRKSLKAQQKIKPQQKDNDNPKPAKEVEKELDTKPETPKSSNTRKDDKGPEKKGANKNEAKKIKETTEIKKDFKKVTNLKKESSSVYEKNKEKKQINKSLDVRKEITKCTDIKKNISKTIQIKRSTRISNVVEKLNLKKNPIKRSQLKKARRLNTQKSTTVEQIAKDKKQNLNNESKPVTRSQEIKKTNKDTIIPPKIDLNNTEEDLKSKIKNKNTKLTQKKVESTEIFEKTPVKSKKEVVEKDESCTEGKKVEIPEKIEDVPKVEENQPEIIVSLKTRSVGPLRMKKDIENNEKDVGPKTRQVKVERDVSPKMIQRPSRKTKEAAAIYMEILSHKLVNDGRIDDDTVSIDSFPELPNVKKTEQRENELKAKARTKDNSKERLKSDEEDSKVPEKVDQNKTVRKVRSKENVESLGKTIKSPKNSPKYIANNVDEKINPPKMDSVVPEESIDTPNSTDKENNKHSNQDKKTKPKEPEQGLDPTEIIEVGIISDSSKDENVASTLIVTEKVPINTIERIPDIELTGTNETDKLANVPEQHMISENSSSKAEITNKIDEPKKLDETQNIQNTEPEAEAIIKPTAESELKLMPNDEPNPTMTSSETKEPGIKRKTRSTRSQLTQTDSSDDSDQSFHLDVKVPRKKKVTRSKTIPKINKIEEKPKILDKQVSTDSDESTSDVNLQILANRQKNKKFTKKRPIKKVENTVYDSDEEPLSKLTTKNTEGNSVSEASKVKPKPLDNKKENKSDTKINISVEASTSKEMEKELEQKETTKPKRECAKRPQNYLPMLSSSDDEDIFHGFDEEAANKTIKTSSNAACSHAPPLLDFLTKDINRRWGKEKVNMSNEQIEKWLKDSALAGSSIKKENDEMLKFGERIPMEIVDPLEADKKTSEFQTEPKSNNKEIPIIEVETSEKADNKDFLKQQNDSVKPFDRKLIFRKNKSSSTPNINAFSPENESSVYAFGEETEEVVSTPFRRPSRRPSSTATSRSEDESSKHEDSLKSGKHYLNIYIKGRVDSS